MECDCTDKTNPTEDHKVHEVKTALPDLVTL